MRSKNKNKSFTACLALINLNRWKSPKLARTLAAANFLAQFDSDHFLSISALVHCLSRVPRRALCGILIKNLVKYKVLMLRA